jgi:hypothetical protein
MVGSGGIQAMKLVDLALDRATRYHRNYKKWNRAKAVGWKMQCYL